MPDDTLPTPPEDVLEFPHPVFYAWGVLPDGSLVVNAFDTTREPSADESLPKAMRYCVMGMTLPREEAAEFLSRLMAGVVNRMPFHGVCSARLLKDFNRPAPEPAAEPDEFHGEGSA